MCGVWTWWWAWLWRWAVVVAVAVGVAVAVVVGVVVAVAVTSGGNCARSALVSTVGFCHPHIYMSALLALINKLCVRTSFLSYYSLIIIFLHLFCLIQRIVIFRFLMNQR